jgi:hypothetical protein
MKSSVVGIRDLDKNTKEYESQKYCFRHAQFVNKRRRTGGERRSSQRGLKSATSAAVGTGSAGCKRRKKEKRVARVLSSYKGKKQQKKTSVETHHAFLAENNHDVMK